MLQVWLFIAPGLYAKEKKLAIPFVLSSSALFIAGAAFSHYLVFPAAWKFFASFSNEFMEFMPRIDPVFGMYVKLILALGFTFQLPVLDVRPGAPRHRHGRLAREEISSTQSCSFSLRRP